MDQSGITRREAHARLLSLAGLAAGSGLVLPRASLAQPRAGRSPLDSVMSRGRTKDWTLRINVHLSSFQAVNSQDVKIIPLKFDTAAVFFPAILSS